MQDRACRQNNHSGGLTAPEDVEKSGNLSDISKQLTQSKILESNVSSREIIISNIYEGTDKDSSDVIHRFFQLFFRPSKIMTLHLCACFDQTGSPKQVLRENSLL